MASSGQLKKIAIKAFDGTNALVNWNIAKAGEFSHVENARSVKIGTVEKRGGSIREGGTTSTAHYGLFYHPNTSNGGLYKVSTVAGVTQVSYFDDLVSWLPLSGFGTSILELGNATTQFDITNPAGATYRYTYDGTGTDPNIDSHVGVGTVIVVAAQFFNAANNGTFTVTGVGTDYFEVTGVGVIESNKTIGTGSITVTGNIFSTTEAEGFAFLVNGVNDNMQIANDGTTVLTSASTSSNLYYSPKARKINFYKGNLYVADYTIGDKQFKNHVLKSSPLLGILGLVDGDFGVGVTTVKCTDTKYIRPTDEIQVWRGGFFVTTLYVSAKGEDFITVTATAVALKSADELWVTGTKSGAISPMFRWPDTVNRGVNVHLYDTFPVSGGINSRIKMLTNVGGSMVIGNDDNLSFWDNSSLTPVDLGIGCVSDKGYVKNSGVLFFLHYGGIYQTTGGLPKLISTPVEPYIKGATTAGLQASAAGKKDFSVFFTIGNVTLYNDDGSVNKTLPDVCLEYEMRQDNWFVHTNVPTRFLETYITSTDPDVLVYLSNDGNKLAYKFLTTDTVDHSGDTDQAEIPFRVDTSEISLTDDEKVVNPVKIIAVTDKGNSIQCFVSLDGGDFYELRGQFNKGVSSIAVTNRDPDRNDPPRCNRIKISLRDYGAKFCKIAKLIIVFSDANEEKQED